MRGTSKIDILLATYNGARYLDALVHSILGQGFTGWRLVVRDDGSTDRTMEILESHARARPDKIRILPRAADNHKGLGACANFGALMGEPSEADYTMFADQDDVWEPYKIDVTLNRMRALERESHVGTPVLIHTDLRVADHNLRELSPSFFAYQKLDPRCGLTLPRLMMQNVITGNTVMINRSLRERATPVPEEAIMHDWWIALVAAAYGRIGYTTEATVLYRQHSANDTGAKRWGPAYMAERMAKPASLRQSLMKTQRQAGALLRLHGPSMPEAERRAAEAFCHLGQMGFVERRAAIVKYGFYKVGLVRNLGLFLMI